MQYLAETLHQPGLIWLTLIVVVAGLVRGFAGFGTGLIFVPLASHFLSPVSVIIAMMVVDLGGTLPLVPRALADGKRRDVALLGVGAALALPMGVYVLTVLDPQAFQWAAALLSLSLVMILVSGWRHRVVFGRQGAFGLGVLSGFVGGVSGMPGPPVILAYLSGQYRPEVIRANILLYLLIFEFLLFSVFLMQGLLEPKAVAIGILLAVPYLFANLIGARIFDPAHARIYRSVAYAIVALSAIFGLPVWG